MAFDCAVDALLVASAAAPPAAVLSGFVIGAFIGKETMISGGGAEIGRDGPGRVKMELR